MNDDNMIGGLLLAFFATISVIFILGTTVGYDNGMEMGKNEGIVFCTENPQKCKVHYDYLKLQENQK